MEKELREVLAQPSVRQRFADLGALPASGGAKELAEFVDAESAKWALVIKTANIKLD
jgi:tripartite-type tricarboxylate transporter receptor subunit TctC